MPELTKLLFEVGAGVGVWRIVDKKPIFEIISINIDN
jgi:hypothetical protein